jgi:hypothetical protein
VIDEAEVERQRIEAERCRYKSGTLGVWARHWLDLYEFMLAAITEAEDRKNKALNG